MKTATVRQVRHDFGTVLEWVGVGEQVQISKRGKIVALLSPPPALKRPPARKRPDLAARLKLRDGDHVIAACAMNDILDDNKGAHCYAQLGDDHTESIGVRAVDLLHVGLARVLGAKEFLTFDSRQGKLAKAAGFKLRFQ